MDFANAMKVSRLFDQKEEPMPVRDATDPPEAETVDSNMDVQLSSSFHSANSDDSVVIEIEGPNVEYAQSC
jgi:hypothetical protein